MLSPFFLIAALPFVLWLVILLLPWQPWRTRESWDSPGGPDEADLKDMTVLIPARNEAANIADTLPRVLAQGEGFRVILIDDRSEDGTGALAERLSGKTVAVLPGAPLPPNWSGKLWALQQGLEAVQTPLTVLLDADIALDGGVLAGLRCKLERESLDFVSLMAMPTLSNFWERLLMPAFVYFFKLLYPFRLSNSPSRWVAAGAGGCILVRTEALRRIGAFACIREALIDDCRLARQVKDAGYRTWIGLTHSARSIRPYEHQADIWNMVARTAYTQLRYYGLSPFWAVTLPLTGTLYLAMTWTSALRYWRGERMRWRGRVVYEGGKDGRREVWRE